MLLEMVDFRLNSTTLAVVKSSRPEIMRILSSMEIKSLFISAESRFQLKSQLVSNLPSNALFLTISPAVSEGAWASIRIYSMPARNFLM